MSDLTPKIQHVLNQFGKFTIIKWRLGGVEPSLLSIVSDVTQNRYTHYIGFTEPSAILSEIQNWMERFTKGRESSFLKLQTTKT